MMGTIGFLQAILWFVIAVIVIHGKNRDEADE